MLRIKTSSPQNTYLVLLFIVAAITTLAYEVTVSAVNQTLWPEGYAAAKVEVTDSGLPALEYWHIKGCKLEQGIVRGVNTVGQLCVVHGKDVSLASFQAPGYGRGGIAVRIGSDSKYYGLSLGIDQSPILVPGTNVFMYNSEYYNYGYYRPTMYRNFMDGLIAVDNGIHPRTYRMKDSSHADYILKAQDGSDLGSSAPAYSRDGRYFVFSGYNGIIFADTKTGYVRLISPDRPSSYSPARIELAVSDDGRYVAVGGYYIGSHHIYHSEGCGDVIPYNYGSQYYNMQNPCEYYDFTSQIKGLYGEAKYNKYSFSSDSGQLSFQLGGQNDIYAANQQVVTITSPGYTPPPQLEYLAMGDSYSSGEGDIRRSLSGVTYYLAGTDVSGDYSKDIPEEKCHISPDSYPFLLKKDMKLSNEEMKSVACSGAVRTDVEGWIGTLSYKENGYEGQIVRRVDNDIPRLQGIQTIESLRAESKANFIPGRIQQIEFVFRNKPKAVTLTMGGNDIQFGKILESCILEVKVGGTCTSATEQGRKSLGTIIRNQFTNLRDLYQNIKKASPTTRLYVVGYPQFVSSTMNLCGVNSTLDSSERRTITESVTYLNSIIKAAASESGAYYIDIENSLGNHTLCGVGEKYVNGLSSVASSAFQEMFHPNAKGHQAIFDKIKTGLGVQNLLTFDDCDNNKIITCPGYGSYELPEVPEYLNPLSTVDKLIVKANMLKNGAQSAVGAVKKGAEAYVKNVPSSFMPFSVVHAELHSNPIDLGDFVTGADGSLDIQITIPDTVGAGFHTLHLIGQTYSGEAVDYYQFIEVRGQNDNDIDDNGVLDTRQQCLYMQESGLDIDSDGIDDACDPDLATVATGTSQTRLDNIETILTTQSAPYSLVQGSDIMHGETSNLTSSTNRLAAIMPGDSLTSVVQDDTKPDSANDDSKSIPTAQFNHTTSAVIAIVVLAIGIINHNRHNRQRSDK